jgi:Zn-finger nucleic acid-binding protein
VFHGHKHCPECGSQIDHAAHGDARADAPCPRCDQPLHPRLLGDVVIDECRGCAGVFLDKLAIERVVTDRRQARAEALLGVLRRGDLPPVAPGSRMYVKCPTCKIVMNRRQFASGARVVVDVCRIHGTFFDAGELPRIIEFVMRGGLEAAERAELQRLRDQARRELQTAQFAAITESRSSTHASDNSGHASAIVMDLLASLLR